MNSQRATRSSELEFGNLAFVALGSNQGNSPEIIRRAIARLQQLSDEALLQSSLWQTTPVDCPPGSPIFVNAVVGVLPRPDETPETLWEKLQALEREFGRKPKQILNEPRTLDLDLIAFRSEIRGSRELTIPHPRAHQRRFVLQPLAEIACQATLAGQSKSIGQLLAELKDQENAQKL
jgi:2-amino-4-hydroxy-6-hydroxymethyldihydropteridine diphosphokinase